MALARHKGALSGLLTALLLVIPTHSVWAQHDHKSPTTQKPIEIPAVTVLGDRHDYIEDNPAIALIEALIPAERQRRDTTTTSFTYTANENLLLSLRNIDKWRGLLNKVVPFSDHYLSHSKLDGSLLLPLSSRNKVTLLGYNADTQKTNEQVIYHKIVGIDRDISDGIVTIQLEHLFSHIDPFDSDIKLLDTEFPSPLGSNARRYYKYYLTDTIITQGKVAQVVDFVPRSPHAPSFNGRLEIAAGKDPQLLRALLLLPKVTNVNYIKELRIQQWYGNDKETPTGWRLQKEQLQANVKLFLNLLSFEVEHNRSFDLYNYVEPDSTLLNTKIQYRDTTGEEIGKSRLQQLHNNQVIASEEGLRHFMDELRNNPFTRFVLDAADMLSINYLRTGWNYNKVYGGSYFDIGPIDQLIGANSTERLRLRIGGRTTGYLSKYNFLEGYIAYGTKDGLWKYGATLAHSFLPKRYFREEYPRHELALSYRYDLYTPGQIIENNDRSNLLYDVGVSYLTTRSFRNSWKLEYINDFSSDLSLRLHGHYYRDTPVGNLEYVRVNNDHSMEKVPQITDVSIGAEIRWSPGERIFEGSMQRQHLSAIPRREVPVFRLKHEWADPLFGGDFTRHSTELTMEQRLWLGTFGMLDYQINVGKLWNAVPYPLLYTPPVNGSFWFRKHAFQLLHPLEFVADNWSTAHMEYHARGVLFDRIPWVKWLRLRGVVSCNLLYGNLSKKNRQATGDELFLLPTTSREMNDEVYAEVGLGLENILEILRIDVYRRITPLTEYSKDPWGVKILISLSF